MEKRERKKLTDMEPESTDTNGPEDNNQKRNNVKTKKQKNKRRLQHGK